MKRNTLSILITCLLIILLGESELYAGKLIDKSSDDYMLYIPKTTLSGKSSPVLVCLPGWGVKAKDDINVWTFPAEKAGFIVVNLDIDYNSIGSEVDVHNLYHRIRRIIDSLSTTYPVAIQKLYIAGTSAGGMTSISLALIFPNKFTAVGVVSGGRLGFGAEDYLTNANGCRFYMVHGKQDRSIPIEEFYSTKRQLEQNGAIVKFNVIPEGAHTLPSRVYSEVVNWLSKINE